MRSFIHILIFLISISLFSQDEKRLALVIGNSNYDKGELKNPVNDARLIASTLDSLDFDVILKENLSTKRDMTAAIENLVVNDQNMMWHLSTMQVMVSKLMMKTFFFLQKKFLKESLMC